MQHRHQEQPSPPASPRGNSHSHLLSIRAPNDVYLFSHRLQELLRYLQDQANRSIYYPGYLQRLGVRQFWEQQTRLMHETIGQSFLVYCYRALNIVFFGGDSKISAIFASASERSYLILMTILGRLT